MNKLYNPLKETFEVTEDRTFQADPIKYQIGEHGCHTCVSHALDKDGYPRVYRNGKDRRMNRYRWQLFNKQEIPEGMVIMHTCDNPHCINPAHLRPGTHLENMLDRQLKGRTVRGSHNGKAKLTEEQIYYIKFITTETNKELSVKFGLPSRTIRGIRSGKTWNWLTEDYQLRKTAA